MTSEIDNITFQPIKNTFSRSSGLHYLQELQKRMEKGANIPRSIQTGFTQLDKIINGLGNSNLIILAGHPGVGKTALSLNIVEHVALKQKIPVGIFSLQMSAEQLLDRIISSQSRVGSSKIQEIAQNIKKLSKPSIQHKKHQSSFKISQN